MEYQSLEGTSIMPGFFIVSGVAVIVLSRRYNPAGQALIWLAFERFKLMTHLVLKLCCRNLHVQILSLFSWSNESVIPVSSLYHCS